jgi:hypothetical protein
MEHPSARRGRLSEGRGHPYEEGRQLCELRETPSEDRERPCVCRRRLSVCLGLPYELRRLPSLLVEHPVVFVGKPCECVLTPSGVPTDARRRSSASLRNRRDALEAPRGSVGVPRATLRMPEETLRTSRDALPVPRDALAIPWDAAHISDDALRVRRASPGRRGDALPVLRASRRLRSDPLGTPGRASPIVFETPHTTSSSSASRIVRGRSQQNVTARCRRAYAFPTTRTIRTRGARLTAPSPARSDEAGSPSTSAWTV